MKTLEIITSLLCIAALIATCVFAALAIRDILKSNRRYISEDYPELGDWNERSQ